MNLYPLVLPLTVTTTALVFVLPNKSGAKAAGFEAEKNVYGYGAGVQYFCLVGALLFAALPCGFYFAGIELSGWQWVACAAFVLFELFVVIYARKYSASSPDAGAQRRNPG